jgi:hypothetical protein
LGVILIPSSNQVVEQGVVPDRPDMTYSWAHDGTSVRFGLTIDDQSKPLVNGTIGTDNLVRDPDGNVIGRIVSGPNGQTLVADLSALDGAAAKLRGDVTASTSAAKEEPKLCPDPTAEPMTTTSPNSIAYQEYVSKLPCGLAIRVGGVNFDGCDPETGKLLEAKANIDFMFDANGKLYGWVDPANDPELQMRSQAEAAALAGRLVVWHAQTEKGYQALSQLADDLNLANLTVIFDPN